MATPGASLPSRRCTSRTQPPSARGGRRVAAGSSRGCSLLLPPAAAAAAGGAAAACGRAPRSPPGWPRRSTAARRSRCGS